MSRIETNWSRYAKALDMRLNDGATMGDIARYFGVSKQRASQMVHEAGRQLAFRVFKHVRRPQPRPHRDYMTAEQYQRISDAFGQRYAKDRARV